MEAVRGQKHPSETKKDMKELIYQKKYSKKKKKVSQQPKNHLADQIRFELQPQIKKMHPSNLN